MTIKNQRGQVAIFIALVFQILFLFFAMVINVGLLVHHKINLQNSVDLAAYYAGMKQAEGMNAVAHVNYQIRQSWKLLSWRYRQLGTAGDYKYHPFNKINRTVRTTDDNTYAGPGGTSQAARDYYDGPAFCITYRPFKPMPDGENTCKDMSDNATITLFARTEIFAGFQVFSREISKISQVLQSSGISRCEIFGSYNYIMLGRFLTSYRFDQQDRMELINALSRGLSDSPDNFYDLDGDRVLDGVNRTLEQNLTAANFSTLSNVKLFNSLGVDGCNAQSSAQGQPAKWLSPIRVFPAFVYTDTRCPPRGQSGTKSVVSSARGFTGDEPDNTRKLGKPQEYRRTPADMQAQVNNIARWVGYSDNLNDNLNFSLGVEKNPWCMAYVGVSAESQPNIPFSPFGSVKLKAQAFVKPFGGKIGPWYRNSWSRGSEISNGGVRTDELVAPRLTDPGQIDAILNDPAERRRMASNYSRFPGDPFGIKTNRALALFGRAIFSLSPEWRSLAPGSDPESTPLNQDSAPNFDHWAHLPFAFRENDTDNYDILAFDTNTQQPSNMRYLELMSVIPDIFDITYYSIEPDFYRKYYTRIKEKFVPKYASSFLRKQVRPDIGYNRYFTREGYSVKDQIREALDFAKKREINIGVETGGLSYLTTKWDQSLTSWVPPEDITNYEFNDGFFGNCKVDSEPGTLGDPEKPANIGNCIVGGRAGYSVKLVNRDYLKLNNLQLGGEGGGQGSILNPPPEDF